MDTKKKNFYIAVAGVLGSGKTTASALLAKELDFHLFEENPADNVFLPLFYKEPKRWALPAQLFYLREKAHQLEKIKTLLARAGVVHDSPIYQDHFTYAKAQLLLGHMTRDEYALYDKFFSVFSKNIPVPDLIIQLNVSPSVIQRRIYSRAREYEKEIDIKYIKLISGLQKKWITMHPHLTIATVKTDDLDLAVNRDHQKKFVAIVKNMIARL